MTNQSHFKNNILRKSISSIYNLGINRYIEKKIFQNCNPLHRLLYQGKSDSYANTVYNVWLKESWKDPTFQNCYFGTYGYFFANYIANIEDEFTFIDAGANQGLYSIIAAKNPVCSKVFCFEPVKKTFRLLTNNLDRNGVGKIATPINAAISNTSGTAEIKILPGNSGVATLRPNNKPNREYENISLVNSKDIDLIFAANNKIIAKVDVEGLEEEVIDVLLKLKKAKNIEAIYYEADENWTDCQKLENKLRDYGFSNFNKIGSGHHYDVLASR